MTLNEFNNLTLEEKYHFIRGDTQSERQLVCFRDDGDYKYILWNCGTFFAETCAIEGKTIKIEGSELTDERVNIYVDWMEEHKDDPKYQ